MKNLNQKFKVFFAFLFSFFLYSATCLANPDFIFNNDQGYIHNEYCEMSFLLNQATIIEDKASFNQIAFIFRKIKFM